MNLTIWWSFFMLKLNVGPSCAVDCQKLHGSWIKVVCSPLQESQGALALYVETWGIHGGMLLALSLAKNWFFSCGESVNWQFLATEHLEYLADFRLWLCSSIFSQPVDWVMWDYGPGHSCQYWTLSACLCTPSPHDVGQDFVRSVSYNHCHSAYSILPILFVFTNVASDLWCEGFPHMILFPFSKLS